MVKIADPVALLTTKPVPVTGMQKPMTCGFCKTENHEFCPRAVRGHGPKMAAKIWPCDCQGCKGGENLRCLECKNEAPGDVDPKLWSCFDQDACQARITTRMRANPALAMMEDIVMARATKTEAKPAAAKRAPAQPKTRDCACDCGGETKGGMFLPGHDARFVKELVASVVDKERTLTQARAHAKATGISEVLTQKFEKAVQRAKDSAQAEKEAAKAEKAKPAAKKAAAPARKRAAAKPAAPTVTTAVEDAEPDDAEDGDDDGF